MKKIIKYPAMVSVAISEEMLASLRERTICETVRSSMVTRS